MNKRLIIVFSILTIAPLALLTWLGVALFASERTKIKEQTRHLLKSQLITLRKDLAQTVLNYEYELLNTPPFNLNNGNYAAIREWNRLNRLTRQVFVLNADTADTRCEFLYPPMNQTQQSTTDHAFLERTASVWQAGLPFSTNQEFHSRGSQGWHTYFYGDGLNLIFWNQNDNGQITGYDISTVTLISDLIAQLPDNLDAATNTCIKLIDSQNHTIYQWGHLKVAPDEEAFVQIALASPLSYWQLHYYVDATLLQAADTRFHFGLASGLMAIGLALIGLSVYYYRENTREARLATQKVSFVNQVSHELKTPLTNIRMYSELLQDELPENLPKTKNYLDIIVSESQRLSRLINNILTFSQEERNQLKLNYTNCVVDEVIQNTIDQFTPSFKRHKLQVSFASNISDNLNIDPDALAQILANLLSNIEKYAASGKHITIKSEMNQQGHIVIHVKDNGLGIPSDKRETIFQPFTRLSDKLSEGSSGTGIGLPIARALARLHGGNLRCVEPSSPGAHFIIELCPR